jgi:hypothetical protein
MACARHAGRHGLGIGARSGSGGDRFCARLWRQGGRDGRGRYDPLRPDRSGHGERRAGARRRDRRFLAGRMASGLQCRSGGVGGGRAVRHQRRALAPRGRARVRRRRAGPRRHPARIDQHSQGHSRRRGRVRRRRSRRLRGGADGFADAMDARLHRATMCRYRLVVSGHRSHREGLRLRRHACAQRRHVRPARSRRLERRRDGTISSWPIPRKPTRGF